jgi:apolipoprotein N-acyltransferase
VRAIVGIAYLLTVLLEVGLSLLGPFTLPWKHLPYSDYVYLLILLAHLVPGAVLLVGAASRKGWLPSLRLKLPEVLFLVCLVFFLFSYIYASNANMDYVQRFMASGGAVRLALDTTQERLQAAARFLPLLLLNLFFYLWVRLRRRPRRAAEWALPLALLSVVLAVLAFPSFASLDGVGPLAFVALVPLFLVFRLAPFGWALFYGVGYGLLQGMLINYWLGTYSLVTLQLVCLVYLVFYAVFLLPTLWLYRRSRRLGFLLLPAAWVVFEYLRSTGFLGFPWGIWGTTQYQFSTLIQISSFTGVWGVSFVALLVNSALAAGLLTLTAPGVPPEAPGGPVPALPPRRGRGGPLLGVAQLGVVQLLSAALVFLFCLGFGLVSELQRGRLPVQKTVRLALIQQNSDPRKTDYRETFDTLVRLTDAAAASDPALVVWSETAFVPNIRRWSQVPPDQHPLAALVRDFYAYLSSRRQWLLTGNDDYELVQVGNGAEERRDYNAAVLFDPSAARVRTYHKMVLVPFTESFPWKETLPGVYQWLTERDVYLWEPGSERVVFQHPAFRFSTPICFEDAFPDHVRRFVRDGAEALLNISNDYWSLTEVEGKQHTVNALFRAVENRVPLVRTTASGLTCYVDTEGRLRASLPYYEQAYLVVDVQFPPHQSTTYTLLGDWFPQLLAALLALAALLSLLPGARRRL